MEMFELIEIFAKKLFCLKNHVLSRFTLMYISNHKFLSPFNVNKNETLKKRYNILVDFRYAIYTQF